MVRTKKLKILIDISYSEYVIIDAKTNQNPEQTLETDGYNYTLSSVID